MSVAVEIRKAPGRLRDQRGSQVVEFAIASAVLLVLLFGIVEYGYVLSFKQGLTQAAAEGARIAAVGGSDTAITNAVKEAVGAFKQTCNVGGLTCKSNTVAWPGVAYACGTNMCRTIEVSYDWKNYPLLPRFPGLGLLVPDTLKSKSTTQVS